MEKHSKKKLQITVGFKEMKNSLINYFKNYYLALNQYADRVRAARKYQSIWKENGLHLNLKRKPKTSTCIMTRLYSNTY